MQTNPENASEFKSVSNERFVGFYPFASNLTQSSAFADFVFGSLLLHFFCINFIN
jgi:hypothetical protein